MIESNKHHPEKKQQKQIQTYGILTRNYNSATKNTFSRFTRKNHLTMDFSNLFPGSQGDYQKNRHPIEQGRNYFPIKK